MTINTIFKSFNDSLKYGYRFFIFILLLGCSSQNVYDEWQTAEEILNSITVPTFPNKEFLITNYAASKELEKNIQGKLNIAIEECSKNGGGKVIVPKGKYYSKGPIKLLSNVNLHFEDGTEILFSTVPQDYLPVVFTRWEGVECYNYSSLIYAYGEKNIAVTGKVILNGQADSTNWWPWKKKPEYGWKEGMPSQLDPGGRPLLFKMNIDGVDVEKRIFGDGGYLRPNFIQFYNCTNVLIDGAEIINSPMWLIHPVICENVTIKNIKAISYGPNNDGIDPESCKNVLIENCVFDTGDDCIAIKSGRNEDGRRINVPSENIIVRNCNMKDGHGGVVIGSEISGGCKNVFVENCEMNSPNLERALRIKSNTYRGGLVENVFMRDVKIGEVSSAVINVNLLYEPEEGSSGRYLPKVKNIYVKNIQSKKSNYALELIGLENSHIENIQIENSKFDGVKKENYLRYVDGLSFKDVEINGKKIIQQIPRPEITSNKSFYLRLGESYYYRHPGAVTYDTLFTETKWNYEQGLLLYAFYEIYKYTDDEKYFKFMKDNLDQYINDEGEINTYNYDAFNVDLLNPGRAILYVYRKTGDEKFKNAADRLRGQIKNQPRTASGGFWHKKIYPDQMWLDGLYMAEPFYAMYSKEFNQPEYFDDITKQFILIEEKTRDEKTGLLYHAWDESKAQKWADPQTGRAPNFWGRAMGWYAMALVDVLDYLPYEHKDRTKLIEILNRLSDALLKYRDGNSNIWYQIIDQSNREGNYLEASASSMFTYAFIKGANKGYLPEKFKMEADKSFKGILKNVTSIESDGYINLLDICRSAGLGGNPYRDGSFEYYISEPKRMNDIKGYAPFLLAALELDKAGYKYDIKK
jgi:rhamnogalacturonyl hydrolase YesR/polygalacturonase